MQREQTGLRAAARKLIGSRAFYAMVLGIVIPIMIQNAITNFVNLLDNIMVGQVGTEPMSGVAIANQMMFVFNLCVFGCISGAGIFSAQFFGAGNHEGVRSCFRYKLYSCAALVTLAILLFTTRGSWLVSLYLHDDGNAAKVAETLSHGLRYLHIMLWGLPAFALTQVYAGTLRETGETALPMRAGIVAVFVNLVFNYLLIFGHLGFRPMGVEGAAVATVLSRYVEFAIVMLSAHLNPGKYPFLRGVYATPRVPRKLVGQITVKGLPLLVNEAMWSLGMATLVQCYSVRGLDVVAAMNISSTISNLFSVTFLSMGSATAILVGQALGANDLGGAKDLARKLIAFTVFVSVVAGLVMLGVAPLIPRAYNTEPHVRALATHLLMIFACCMPLFAYANAAYFTLRSGGKTMLTFVFDSCFTWVILVPMAWILVHWTGMDVRGIYLCVQLSDIIKVAFGHVLIQKGIWINNMVA